ncbi:esterase/lipase [Cerasibacillus quisquiliarum]|uniref:Carboxylesterase n=1 Tax=Cerasibacillus quisquiliarum TaxID=227865 RepID=A0A511V528_9BACI|nr:alpha/beta fold hydrolase [Cerasibacillus quisquiliarum]MBB5147438.1 esterase/lipase [Cerasibacillus quisquiliarum]GEN32312.1 carboxylesterase [Cerasibacillus quisquiliarum]
MVGCLLIHGYTGGPHELAPLTNYLREHTDWEIIVPILPGHGEPLDLADRSYKEWLLAAEEAYLSLKETCDTVYVIGFSMGGMISVYLAAKYKVDRLVLLATAGKYLSFGKIIVNIGEFIEDGLKGNLQENKYFNHYKDKLEQVPLQANFEFMKLVNETRQFLKDVKAPVFIAHGQEDSLVPYKTAYYLEKELASEKKEVVIFERSDHLICLGNDSEVLIKMVYDFLNKPL